MIAPFLWYDADPYLVVSGGRLVWLQDAYTFTDQYPYSTPHGEQRELHPQRREGGHRRVRRHHHVLPGGPEGSDCGHATSGIFPVAVPPPERRCPRICAGTSAIRKTLFSIQTSMYTTFHMTNPAVFYNKEDQWDVPAIEGSEAQPERMEPYYTIMKLPGEDTAEFIQMVPLTPRRKDNLAAWMVARSDGEHYGQLVRVPLPEAEGRVRPAAGGGAHQPGPGDLAADHALEPAGIAGDPGHAARHPDRGVADLHPAAVPAQLGRHASRS